MAQRHSHPAASIEEKGVRAAVAIEHRYSSAKSRSKQFLTVEQIISIVLLGLSTPPVGNSVTHRDVGATATKGMLHTSP